MQAQLPSGKHSNEVNSNRRNRAARSPPKAPDPVESKRLDSPLARFRHLAHFGQAGVIQENPTVDGRASRP